MLVLNIFIFLGYKDSPSAIPEDVSTIKGVDWYVFPHFAGIVTKERVPTAKQHLVLQGKRKLTFNIVTLFSFSESWCQSCSCSCCNVGSYLEIYYGDAVPVRPADDGVEVLKLRGQEGSKCSLQADSTSLLEAQEVCPTNPSHVTGVRAVQGDEVQLIKTDSQEENHTNFHFTSTVEQLKMFYKGLGFT